jgi:hypothetical protein
VHTCVVAMTNRIAYPDSLPYASRALPATSPTCGFGLHPDRLCSHSTLSTRSAVPSSGVPAVHSGQTSELPVCPSEIPSSWRSHTWAEPTPPHARDPVALAVPALQLHPSADTADRSAVTYAPPSHPARSCSGTSGRRRCGTCIRTPNVITF